MGYDNSEGQVLKDGPQNEIKANEKMMKVDYFLGVVMIIFPHPLFSRKYPFSYYAKLLE